MACDLLVLAPHPDDAELYCGGTIARHVRLGHRVAIVDATRGELGSRGTPAGRAAEASAAAEALGVVGRENLGLPDGGIDPTAAEQRRAVVAALRRWRPRLALAIHPHARHPDHVALGGLLAPALKLAGIHGFDPTSPPALQGARGAWYESELPIPTAGWLVPCSEADWERKRAALACHASQFGLDGQDGPPTAISSPDFLRWIDDRARSWGYLAGAPYAEAFAAREPLVLGDLCAVVPDRI